MVLQFDVGPFLCLEHDDTWLRRREMQLKFKNHKETKDITAWDKGSNSKWCWKLITLIGIYA